LYPSLPYTPFHEPRVVLSLVRKVAVPPDPDGLTVTAEDVIELPLYVARIVAVVAVVTAAVATLKAWVAAPAATVTFADGIAAFEPASATAAPPLGAGPFNVIVTLTGFPPTTELGETATEETTAGSSVTVAVPLREPSLSLAVTVTFCVLLTDAGAV
jgi:hypothetical protein